MVADGCETGGYPPWKVRPGETGWCVMKAVKK